MSTKSMAFSCGLVTTAVCESVVVTSQTFPGRTSLCFIKPALFVNLARILAS